MVRFIGLILAGALLAGCSGETAITTKPDSTASTAPSGKTAAAKVGDSITLKGSDNKKARVTILKVIDPAKPTGDFDKPDPGTRWVAVQMKIENSGTVVIEDAPLNGLTAIDGAGQQFDPYVTGTAIGGPQLGTIKISGGDARTGFLVFKVPTASKLVKIQFALDSGFADDTGEWVIG